MHDNAPSHTARLTKEKLKDFKWKVLDHPPYSPDPSPSDYFLFRNMKNELFRSKYVSADEVETKVTAYFDGKPSNFF